jgi:hypothetical protein
VSVRPHVSSRESLEKTDEICNENHVIGDHLKKVLFPFYIQ